MLYPLACDLKQGEPTLSRKHFTLISAGQKDANDLGINYLCRLDKIKNLLIHKPYKNQKLLIGV